MHRLLVAALLVAVLIGSAKWGGAQQPPPGDENFTGKSEAMDAKDLSVSRRRFEAGARSNWHSHDRGQVIYVESGRARTQKRGQPVKELAQGESDYTGPNVVHWHGAAPDQAFVQVAVGFGGQIHWMQKVTDEEYTALRK